jgi:hypothetical protein
MTRPLIGAALALVLGLAACSQGPPVGTAAPAFSAVDAHGDAVSLAAYDDKVLILDFWAVW